MVAFSDGEVGLAFMANPSTGSVAVWDLLKRRADAAGHEDVGFSSPKFEWNVYHSTCLKWSEARGKFIRNRLIFGRDGPPEAANGQGVALVVVRDVCDRFLSSYAKYVQLWRRGKVPLGDPLEDANEFLTKHKHDLSSHHVLFRHQSWYVLKDDDGSLRSDVMVLPYEPPVPTRWAADIREHLCVRPDGTPARTHIPSSRWHCRSSGSATMIWSGTFR